MARGSPCRTMFSKPVHETITNPSDIARPHDDQYVARSQLRLEKLLDIHGGVQAGHILPQRPGPRGEIGGRNLARLGGAFSSTKDVGYQHPLGILQAEGQFVQ